MMSRLPTNPVTVFTYGMGNLKFRPGAANEIGSNPIADMWSEKSLKLLARSCRTAVLDGDDVDARMKQQQLATTPRLVTEDDAAGIFTRSIALC
jgi:alcohol dehydrogenase class IV